MTVLLPCVEPNPLPLIDTPVPPGPELGKRLVIVGLGAGGESTAKLTPLLATPATVTTTLPVVAPVGAGTTIEVEFQLAGVAGVPLKLTELPPCVPPKPVPLIATDVPTTPEVGDKFVMLGADPTVNSTPLLPIPPTAISTFPVVAPVGTGTTIDVSLQLVGVATMPLKVALLLPWIAPKLLPATVTDVPTGPMFGEMLFMVGNVCPEREAPATKTKRINRMLELTPWFLIQRVTQRI